MRQQSGLFLVALMLCVACDTAPAPSSPPGPTAPPVVLTTLVNVPLSVDVTEGLVGTWNYAGQSVTLPSGGAFDNIRFAWYHYKPRGEATAFGRIYVLDREYLGAPSGLSSDMPGFLGRSDVQPSGLVSTQGTEYALPADLVLQGGTTYWFYTDTQGAFANSFDLDLYPGGTHYISGMRDLPFRISVASGRMVNGAFVPAPPGVTTDANFRLRGNAR
jgi:hypothetical protein